MEYVELYSKDILDIVAIGKGQRQFNEKLGVLKENYFPTNEAKAETTSDEEPVTNSEELNEEVVDPSMTQYVDALARFGQNT